MMDDVGERASFRVIQRRLREPFGTHGSPPRTVVVVPSMTMDSAGLAKIPGVNHYEERFLIFLQWLRRPGTNIVYVTSEPIAPAILAYILDLLPGCGGAATRRLTMLDCGSRAPVPLSAKVLGRPDVVEAIRAAVPDPADAVLLAFNGSPVERALAVRLGIPLYAPDPDLAALGSKTGSRRLFAEAGIPMADGIEDLRGEADVVAALAELRGRDRTLGTALVKLNDSFGAGGNVLFSFAGAPRTGLTGWIRRELPARAEFASPPDTWETYREKLDAMGAVVERFVEAAQTASPSAQVLLAPGGAVRVLAAHDQVLSGPSGQIFVGCRFPARAGYRREIHRLALRAGRSLAGHGVVGLVSVDFLCARTGPGWRHYGLEINLRMGGGTAPFFTLLGLAGGDCDPVTGRYLDATGRPRAYFATDRLHRAEYQALDPAQVIATLERSGLRYEPASSTGVVAYMLGALEIGRFGIVSIDTGAAAATARYRRVVAAIDAAAAGREVSVPAPRRRPARRIRPG